MIGFLLQRVKREGGGVKKKLGGIEELGRGGERNIIRAVLSVS